MDFLRRLFGLSASNSGSTKSDKPFPNSVDCYYTDEAFEKETIMDLPPSLSEEEDSEFRIREEQFYADDEEGYCSETDSEYDEDTDVNSDETDTNENVINENARVSTSTTDYTDCHDKEDESSSDYSELISQLKPVTIRQYTSVRTLKPENTMKLVNFLRRQEKLQDVSKLSQITKLHERTLRRWHEKARNDLNWSPLISKRIPTRKAMTDLLEDAIWNYINNKFLSKGFQVNDRICRTVALEFWDLNPSQRLAAKFKGTYRWIKRFKQKYNIVNRTVHHKRRPAKTPEYVKRCRDFYDNMVRLYNKHKQEGTLHLLINVDETCFKTFRFGELTWAAKGSEHVEFANVWNTKESITAIAAITADKDLYKLPLCIIKKGKTNNAKKAFNNSLECFQIFITENGWTTTTCFGQYLVWLRNELNLRYEGKEGFDNNTNIDLVLDVYAAHRNDQIKTLAEKLNFTLHFIPSGSTDIFQPLDRYVFGALKNMATSVFYEKYCQNPQLKYSLSDAIITLLECWSQISSKTFAKAWDVYSSPDEDEYDKLVRQNQFDSVVCEGIETINIPTFSESSEEERIDDGTSNETNITEIEQTSDSSDDDDVTNFSKLPDCIKDKMRNDIAIEKNRINQDMLLEKQSQFKTIINEDNTCYINATLQLLSQIVTIRNFLPAYVMANPNDNSIIDETLELFNRYDQCPGKILYPFAKNEFPSFVEDVRTNIETILEPFNDEYGVHTESKDALFLFVHSQNCDASESDPDVQYFLSPSEVLDEYIANEEYRIGSVLFFQKAAPEYEFPDVFWYGKYCFISRAFCANIENKHYYVYSRDQFTNNWVRLNDDVLTIVSYNDIVADNYVISAMYQVYEDETKVHNAIITHTIESVLSKTQEKLQKTDFVVSKEIEEAMKYLPKAENLTLKIAENTSDEKNRSRKRTTRVAKLKENPETQKILPLCHFN